MNDWYFYLDGSQAIGPVLEKDIEERIRQKKIEAYDLVFKDGEAHWRPAVDFVGFRPVFAEIMKRRLPQEDVWIVLKKPKKDRSRRSDGFKTIGPFSSQEMRDKLDAGEVEYTDYIWKQGLSQWVRIALVPDFAPKPQGSSVRVDESGIFISEPKADASEMLRTVVPFQRVHDPLRPLPAPPEAEGPDLTKVDADVLRARISSSRVEAPEWKSEPLPRPLAEDSAAELPVEFIEDGDLRSGLRILLAVLVVVAFGAGTWFFIHELARSVHRPVPKPAPVSHRASGRAAHRKPAPKSKRPIDSVRAQNPPSAAVSHPPTWIHLNIHQDTDEKVRFDVQTDASVGVPLWVEIRARAGQVDGPAAYFHRWQVHPQKDGRIPIQTGALRLPSGSYLLVVSHGELEKSAEFSLGVHQSGFAKGLKETRKKWAYLYWGERQHLFRLAQDLSMAWSRGRHPKIGELEHWSEARGARYVFFDEWKDLKQIYDHRDTSHLRRFLKHIAVLSVAGG